MKKSDRPTVVDMFCGCGGLSEGFKQSGFDVVLGVDCDPWAVKTYNKYHNDRGRIKKVQDIDANYIFTEAGREEIDILVAGPPCQAFSTVALAKWRSLGMPSNLQHPLNRLYRECLRLVQEVCPKFFVMENVQRMLSISNGAVRKVIESELKNKYTVTFYRKDAADFGVPQHRKRALVIGNRLGLQNPEFEDMYSNSAPLKKRYSTVHDAISDLPRIKSGEGTDFMKYPPRKYLSRFAKERRMASSGVYNHVARVHNNRDLKIFSMIRPGRRISDIPECFNPYRKDIFIDKYKKQAWDKPSSTIVAHLAKDGLMFIHPEKRQNRSFTAREAARLQSFDDSYVFEGSRFRQFIQIGNAIPPILARTIAMALKGLLQPPFPVLTYSPSQSRIAP